MFFNILIVMSEIYVDIAVFNIIRVKDNFLIVFGAITVSAYFNSPAFLGVTLLIFLVIQGILNCFKTIILYRVSQKLTEYSQ